MQVNAIGPALLLKHLAPLMATGERVIWAKLSARVGSIEDNRKGGWYGYRASRRRSTSCCRRPPSRSRAAAEAVIAALQPGTVRSALSRPFVGEQAMAPAESAQRLLAVIDTLPARGERTLWTIKVKHDSLVRAFQAV